MARTHAIAADVAALAALLVAAPFVAGCPPERPSFDAQTIARAQDEGDTSPTVATVGEQALTFASFNRRLNALPPYARARYGTIEALTEFLDAQITVELMADAARAQRMARAPEVVDAVKDAVAERAEDEALRRRLDADPDAIADDEAEDSGSYQDQREAAREAAVDALLERTEIAVDEQALKRLRPPASPAAYE